MISKSNELNHLNNSDALILLKNYEIISKVNKELNALLKHFNLEDKSCNKGHLTPTSTNCLSLNRIGSECFINKDSLKINTRNSNSKLTNLDSRNKKLLKTTNTGYGCNPNTDNEEIKEEIESMPSFYQLNKKNYPTKNTKRKILPNENINDENKEREDEDKERNQKIDSMPNLIRKYNLKIDSSNFNPDQLLIVKNLALLVNNAVELFNSVDSAGDKITSIINFKSNSSRLKYALMYMINFEIWGMYEGNEKSSVSRRRETALNSLDMMISQVLYHVKEFQILHATYDQNIA